MIEKPEPLFIAAVAAIIFHQGKVLAMRRSRAKDAGAGLWETLSGRLRPREAPLAAIERETREESGLQPQFDARPFAVHVTERVGLPMVLIYYRGRSNSSEVTISWEHDDYAWLTPGEFSRTTTLTHLAEIVLNAARDYA